MKRTIATYLPSSVRSASATRVVAKVVSRTAQAAARTKAAAAGHAYAQAWRRDPAPVARPARAGFDEPARRVLRRAHDGQRDREVAPLLRDLRPSPGEVRRQADGAARDRDLRGGSLDMWQAYLGPGSELYGVDIDPYCTRFEEATISIGDQADRAFWQTFRAETPPLTSSSTTAGTRSNSSG